jgi:uncharacterized protein YjbJ (UPF0337 family)
LRFGSDATLSSVDKRQVSGERNIIKGDLKQKWATLTDDDFLFVQGKQDELHGQIQKRIGETLQAVRQFRSALGSMAK